MSVAPSQRRGLPQSVASNRPARKSAAAPSGATEYSVDPAAQQGKQAELAAVTRATTTKSYVFRKSPLYQSQRHNTTTKPTCQRGDDHKTNEAGFAHPVAVTFPRSSQPLPQQPPPPNGMAANNNTKNGMMMMMQPIHNDDGNSRNRSNNNSGTAAVAGEGPAFVDLSITPEKPCRARPAAGPAIAERNVHSNNPSASSASSSSPQYVDPSADSRSSAQAGDSSFVFALSEDSELKVLASRVGPSAKASPAIRAAGQQGMPHTTNQRRVVVTGRPIASSNATHSILMNGLNANGMYRPAPAAGQLQPPTHGVYRSARNEGEEVGEMQVTAAPVDRRLVQVSHQPQLSSSVGNNTGPHSAPPQQQHQQQPTVKATRAAFASSTGIPLYRTGPHELPSPPALHVYPGGIPGTGIVPPPTGHSNSTVNSRWATNGIPSVSLYSTVAPTATASKVATHTTGSSLSNVSSAAPEGSASVKSFAKPLSSDARSLHSNTPPPPSFAAQTVDKNFTPAQLEAVMREVQQELYLNYTAVPIPADMINLGDTEERRRRLEQRQKQIAYGKETEGYAKYTCLVPRLCDREYHNPLHALTPRPEYDCSKRQFDRVLNAWRRQLHQWDDCDLDNPDKKFLPSGKATLLDLSLAQAPPPVAHTPTGNDQPPVQPQQQQQQPTGVMHSIANVAAMTHDHDGVRNRNGAGGQQDDEDRGGTSHTRSPVFTGNTPTSALYSSGLSMHIHSGRASAITAAACTPSRPQVPEGAEGPQVDDSFFLCMNSGSSRIASPFHPTYSGTGHVAGGNMGGANVTNISGSYHCSCNNGCGGGGAAIGGLANGRSSASAHYQQFMRNSSYAHHNGGTPGNNYAMNTGLTPAHRPPSRNSVPHHITAIFGSEYELMTPSGPGSPSGMPHNPRSGGSPYRLGEPWMPNRSSPTYAPTSVAQGPSHRNTSSPANNAVNANVTSANNSNIMATPISSAVVPSNITAANSAGTMVITGTRGESPLQSTELALIPSTEQSSNGGFAQSPYGFRVHSPVQAQSHPSQTVACATPLTHSQSRTGGLTAANNPPSGSPSRSPIGLPPQQRERVAIATTMAVTARSRRGSGLSAAPTTWTPPNPQVQVRPSPHTPQLHIAATPRSMSRPGAQD